MEIAPVGVGTLLLLRGSHLGLPGEVIVSVDLIEIHDNPESVPWNTGSGFPVRAGVRVLHGRDKSEPILRGVVWLDHEGRDRDGNVLGVLPQDPENHDVM